MTQRMFEVGDVVTVGSSNTVMVVLELMDECLAWVCVLENCQAVDLVETADLRFISKGGQIRCKRLQRKIYRFPSA